MFRTTLSCTALAAALALPFVAAPALAQESTTSITGGGATAPEFDYLNELALFNASAGPAAATFNNPDGDNALDTLYWPSASTAGQAAFLNNDITCDANKVTGNNGGNCSGVIGGASTVDYAASDAPLNATQINQWSTSPVGQVAAGNLIQLPSMGTGPAIPVVNSKVTQNGANSTNHPVAGGVVLTDDDLCGIFSGKITDWSATSAAAHLTPGAITVVYRSDGSGTTFLVLNHFAAVCTTSNSNFPPSETVAGAVAITPSTTFTSAFPGGKVPANFVGEKGSSGVASYLANAEITPPTIPVTSAIGYVSPDYTTVDPNSNAVLANGTKSPLVVAAIRNGLAYIPTVNNITVALNHAQLGTTLTPPTTAAAAALPENFVPVIQTVQVGYPIVGYTTLDFAQCYHSVVIARGILAFLSDHYSNTAYVAISNNNGLVAINATSAKVFARAIQNGIMTNAKHWNTNIQNQTVCSKLVGR